MEKIIENFLDRPISIGVRCHPMAKKTPKPEKIQIRPTEEDFAIIQAGMRKHGLDMSQILRMALRRFAEAEGMKQTT